LISIFFLSKVILKHAGAGAGGLADNHVTEANIILA
jgi:hypothetical protein